MTVDLHSVHVDNLVARLDNIVGRLTLADAVLRLERESAKWWIVVDDANDRVMVRADRPVCERFMRRFVELHPETRIASSGRGPQATPEHANASHVSSAVAAVEPTPLPDTPDNVYPMWGRA